MNFAVALGITARCAAGTIARPGLVSGLKASLLTLGRDTGGLDLGSNVGGLDRSCLGDIVLNRLPAWSATRATDNVDVKASGICILKSAVKVIFGVRPSPDHHVPASLHVVGELDIEKVGTLIPAIGGGRVVDNNGISCKVCFRDFPVVGEFRGHLDLMLLLASPVDTDKSGIPGVGLVVGVLGVTIAPMTHLQGVSGASSRHLGVSRIVDGLSRVASWRGLPTVLIEIPHVVRTLGDPIAIVDLVPGMSLAADGHGVINVGPAGLVSSNLSNLDALQPGVGADERSGIYSRKDRVLDKHDEDLQPGRLI